MKRKKKETSGSVPGHPVGPLQRGAPKPPEYPLSGRRRSLVPRMANGDQSQVSADRENAQVRTAVKETLTLSRKHAAGAEQAIEQWGRVHANLDPRDQSRRDLTKWYAGKTVLQILTDSLALRRNQLGEHHLATKRARNKLEAFLSLSEEQQEQVERDAKVRQKQKKMHKTHEEGRVGMAYELTAREKEARSHAAILSTLRQVIKAKRALWGKKITSVKKLFHLIDTDDSRTVDMVEFVHALTRLGLGLSEDAVLRLGKALDTDGGGTIDYQEFNMWMETGKVPQAGAYDQKAFSDKRREHGGEHGQGLADDVMETVAEVQADEEIQRNKEKLELERKAKENRRKALLQKQARQRLFVQPYADLLTSWLRDEVNTGGYASTPRMLDQMFSAATACSNKDAEDQNNRSPRSRNPEQSEGLRLHSEQPRNMEEDALNSRSDVVIEGALLQMVLEGANAEALRGTTLCDDHSGNEIAAKSTPFVAVSVSGAIGANTEDPPPHCGKTGRC